MARVDELGDRETLLSIYTFRAVSGSLREVVSQGGSLAFVDGCPCRRNLHMLLIDREIPDFRKWSLSAS